MNRRLKQLRSLRRSRKLALLAYAGAAAATGALAVAGRPGLALVPLAGLLAVLALQLVLFERRTVSELRRIERRIARGDLVDMDRIEFLQQRILASIETHRLETAERFDNAA